MILWKKLLIAAFIMSVIITVVVCVTIYFVATVDFKIDGQKIIENAVYSDSTVNISFTTNAIRELFMSKTNLYYNIDEKTADSRVLIGSIKPNQNITWSIRGELSDSLLYLILVDDNGTTFESVRFTYKVPLSLEIGISSGEKYAINKPLNVKYNLGDPALIANNREIYYSEDQKTWTKVSITTTIDKITLDVPSSFLSKKYYIKLIIYTTGTNNTVESISEYPITFYDPLLNAGSAENNTFFTSLIAYNDLLKTKTGSFYPGQTTFLEFDTSDYTTTVLPANLSWLYSLDNQNTWINITSSVVPIESTNYLYKWNIPSTLSAVNDNISFKLTFNSGDTPLSIVSDIYVLSYGLNISSQVLDLNTYTISFIVTHVGLSDILSYDSKWTLTSNISTQKFTLLATTTLNNTQARLRFSYSPTTTKPNSITIKLTSNANGLQNGLEKTILV
jgi:hypothetical protein